MNTTTKNPRDKDPTVESTILPWGPYALPYFNIGMPEVNIIVAAQFRDAELGKMEELE